MRSLELADFSELTLKFYQSAQESSLEAFQDNALNLLRTVVPFDSSIWGTATMTTRGVDIHLLHLHRTSDEMLRAYELVKHEDTSARSMIAMSRSTQGFHSPTAFDQPEFREFLRRFGHQNFFVSQHINPVTQELHSISLYRAHRDAHCSEDERQLLAAVRPHLMQALAINWARHCERAMPLLPGLTQGFAVCDLRGTIQQSDPMFDKLLRGEWSALPEKFSRLPDVLMRQMLAGEADVIGRVVVLRRRLIANLLFLRVRARCRADRLTPRELAIARLIGKGETYKQIAQRLSRSPATVRNQIRTIYAKLQVDGIAGLIEAMRPVE